MMGILNEFFGLNQPFMQANGMSLATFFARFALWAAFTTASTSLYAWGASSATPLSDLLRIIIPLWASWFTTSFPCHFFVAARLLIVLPAP